MPNIDCSKEDLEFLVGKKFSKKELEEQLLFVKGEIDSLSGDMLRIDVKDTNRPDLWSVEGIARELRGRLGIEKKIEEIEIPKSSVEIMVDSNLKNIRPKAAYAIAKKCQMDDEIIRQLIQLQEKICQTFGRKRKEVAIGIFDFDKIKGNLRYFAAEPSFEFVPLGFSESMSLREILYKHPKGKEYGHLIEKFDRFPLLIDSNNEVLSMPPIINSEGSGKITIDSKNLFIDVTGFNQETVNIALRVICLALIERKARIESCAIKYPDKKIITPDFGFEKIDLPKELIEKTTGMQLKEKETMELLAKARMKAIPKNNYFEVHYPNYRADILHPIDIIEDILISFDYNKISPEEIKLAVIGSELGENKKIDFIRETCVGLGFQEALTYTMTSKQKQTEFVLLKENDFVEIANPVSSNYSVFRKKIFPELLEFLAKNKNARFPQKIFEIGRTIQVDELAESNVRENTSVCLAISHSSANYSEAKSIFEAIAKNNLIEFELKKTKHNSFIQGRSVEIISNKKTIGLIGEINPQVLQNFGIEVPATIIEFEIPI